MSFFCTLCKNNCTKTSKKLCTKPPHYLGSPPPVSYLYISGMPLYAASVPSLFENTVNPVLLAKCRSCSGFSQSLLVLMVALRCAHYAQACTLAAQACTHGAQACTHMAQPCTAGLSLLCPACDAIDEQRNPLLLRV